MNETEAVIYIDTTDPERAMPRIEVQGPGYVFEFIGEYMLEHARREAKTLAALLQSFEHKSVTRERVKGS